VPHTMTMKTRQEILRLRSERGQSFVEFAFILPFLVFLVLGIVQFGGLWHGYIAITDAARVGARAAAVHRTTNPCANATTAIQNMNVIPAGSTITCLAPALTTGAQVTVTITYSYSVGLPGYFGVPPVQQDFTVTSTAKERLE
jgi:Flp pilus assembly protein TadG